MRTHIENDIYLSSSSGGLGYTIDKRTMVNVRDKETKEIIGQEESFVTVPCGNHTTLSGAIKGLLHHKVVSLSNDTVLTLTTLSQIIVEYKTFIESKFEI